MRSASSHDQRVLLTTVTGEPFQPVRLYFQIPGRAFVVRKLQALRCMRWNPSERCWGWLYDDEASVIRFKVDYADLPPEVVPILLGRLLFGSDKRMTLQVGSVDRAIEAARFFAPLLGPGVVMRRARIVNHLFAADVLDVKTLFQHLDRDVTVIDWRVAERDMQRDFKDAKTREDFERIAAQRMKARLESKRDVPAVEDFPLAPEEETPDFQHLATTLRLRSMRAMEHWNGNTHLTLTAIILRTFAPEALAAATAGG